MRISDWSSDVCSSDLVYHSIKSGESACHLAYDGERYVGLLVSKISVAEFSGTRSLFVWIAHNEGSVDVLDAGLSLLRDMAGRANASRIPFGPPRPDRKSVV